MKTVIKGALALVLLASSAQAALAQDNGEHRRADRDDGGYNPAMRASNRNAPPSQQPAPQPQAPQPQAQAQAPSQGQGGSQNWQGGRRGDGSWQSRQPGAQGQQAQPPQQPPQNGQRWNNGSNNNGQSWQGQNNNAQGQRRDDQRNDPRWNSGSNNNGQAWQGQNNNQGQRRDDQRNDRNDPRWNNGANGWNNNGRDWRPDRQPQRPRFDRQYYGHNYRSQQRYRGYAYRPPSGFYIRSWSYGDLLPRSWWGPQYRLNDWWSYGLPIPPIGYEYVRVGDDVLLVDMFSGRVVQVIYDVFW